VGDGAPATPPFWLCAPTKVGALGGWNHRRGRQRRCRRPLPGRVECPPCASRYSPGAPQSSGSPACSALSRLMSTHARRSERLSGVIALIVRRFTIPKVQRIPSPVRGIRKRRNRPRCEEVWPGTCYEASRPSCRQAPLWRVAARASGRASRGGLENRACARSSAHRRSVAAVPARRCVRRRRPPPSRRRGAQNSSRA
jgi:hypothetical protein